MDGIVELDIFTLRYPVLENHPFMGDFPSKPSLEDLKNRNDFPGGNRGGLNSKVPFFGCVAMDFVGRPWR